MGYSMDNFRESVHLGKWDSAGLERMLAAAATVSDICERIDYISRQFLGTPYRETTLVGSPDVPEKLVVCLHAVDCFTYVDYVEAMRFSSSFKDFRERLITVRYRQGAVAYGTRNHFFTDWMETSRVKDVSAVVGLAEARSVLKVLNRKSDGSLFLPGVAERTREVTFIPATALDEPTMDRLHTGDYVGIYADTDGLDVSHVGIIVRRDENISFRHASLIERMVVDQDFRNYLSGKPGIIVLRPEG